MTDSAADIALPLLADAAAAAPPPAPERADVTGAAGRLVDAHGRAIRDLRLSVTDRCNYRCVYCMDPDFRYMPKRQLLRLEEYLAAARVCVGLGVSKIRVTGGEPTLYPQLDELLEGLGRLPVDDLAMTTNGSLLTEAKARRWRAAGLRRITLSLDSLRPERVAAVTRTQATPETITGAIAAARAAGLGPIKVNAVIMRGVNDDELADFADFARRHEIDMRLIEFMPLDSSRAWSRRDVVGADEMLDRIGRRHELAPLDRANPDSTALDFAFADGAPGRIGIIAPVTRAFCGACSRLRITADGKVRPCLFSHQEWDLGPLLRGGADDRRIARFVVDAVWTKQAAHGIGAEGFTPPPRTMSAIGG
ncbi:MAG: GTP 3',8-cyclase MoaA [Planctomycetota bacterium]|jgi:cyclic pyranopterin phosphate synthase